MAAEPQARPRVFDPAAFETFRFVGRELDDRGRVRLRYALGHGVEFVEEIDLPAGTRVDPAAAGAPIPSSRSCTGSPASANTRRPRRPG
jgi:hypothetical protein